MNLKNRYNKYRRIKLTRKLFKNNKILLTYDWSNIISSSFFSLPPSHLFHFELWFISMLLLYENNILNKYQQEITETCWQNPYWEVDGPGVMKN